MADAVSHIALLLGAVFMLLAALGLLRLPDIYMRLQAASKASTMGVGWFMFAVAVHFDSPSGILRAVATFSFIYFSAPVAAHLLGRVAYVMGVPLWKHTRVDELQSLSSERAPAEP